MEIGKNIKEYRKSVNLSQDDLAEKIYVSRQTISSWENDKSYPDLQSIILLAQTFNLSIDNLVKGDLAVMQEVIDHQEIMQFKVYNHLHYITLFLVILTSPLVIIFRWWGLAVFIPLVVAACFIEWRYYRLKKKYNAHTFKQVLAFMNGESLDEVTQIKEAAKKPYQKILKFLIIIAIGLAIGFLVGWIIR
jgi:transcriptional regulator with XRE-family HTH domain